MSLELNLTKKLHAHDLFGGQLEKFGIREHGYTGSETERCLSDGRNCLWVYMNEDGSISYLKIWGLNNPESWARRHRTMHTRRPFADKEMVRSDPNPPHRISV